jgi:hypothetical protein
MTHPEIIGVDNQQPSIRRISQQTVCLTFIQSMYLADLPSDQTDLSLVLFMFCKCQADSQTNQDASRQALEGLRVLWAVC